jgi:hypothetical protein
MTGLLEAAREAKLKGTFSYADRIVSGSDLNARLKE